MRPAEYDWEYGWTCNICKAKHASTSIFDHMRLIHPDINLSLDYWPDGGLIVEEEFDTVSDALEAGENFA